MFPVAIDMKNVSITGEKILEKVKRLSCYVCDYRCRPADPIPRPATTLSRDVTINLPLTCTECNCFFSNQADD